MTASVLVLITGGTLDSCLGADVPPDARSCVPEVLAAVNLAVEAEWRLVCMKDSRYLTDDDRAELARIIRHSPARSVVITHGTDTMCETARYLDAELGPGRTVVLVGAMVPLRQSPLSDAGFNLGFAVAQAMTLPSGVYVAMNGRALIAHRVEKDRQRGVFVEVGTV